MHRPHKLSVRRALVVFMAMLAVLDASSALADVRREGVWPENDELVTLSASDLSRAEAIRRLSTEAGWSVVVQGTLPGTVDVQVKRQPASKVLELILADGDFRARREGNLVSIAPAAPADRSPPNDIAAAPATGTRSTGAASASPRAGARPHGEDRVVTGGSIRVEKDQVVGDLVIFGGSAQVLGTVSGDVSVFGGSLEVKDGARIYGDVATFGGSVRLDEGARIDGDVSVVAGSLDRHDKAIVGGSSLEVEKDAAKEPRHERSAFATLASGAGGLITQAALLFAFGAVLLALASRRMEHLQHEVRSRPMRSFALGVGGLVVGVIAVVALCITILGIPMALVGVLGAVFGVYAGICAALTTLGAALLHRKTSSPYLHLAVGCALYLLLSSIPFVGHFVTLLVGLIGFGALVATRAAGLVARHGGPPVDDPYRAAAI